MAFSIVFSEEKNQLLKATRGLTFDEIKDLLATNLLADIEHPSKKYQHQRIYIIRIGDYAYAVPYIIDSSKQEIFLKTAFPSRAFTKQYITGGTSHDSKN